MNKAALSAEYDRLYDKADAVLKELNPCQIQRRADGMVSCLQTRNLVTKYTGIENMQSLCCTSCEHLGPEGCTVKALWCKTWTCYTIHSERPDAVSALNAITSEAMNKGVPIKFFRASKDVAFKEMEEYNERSAAFR